MGPADQTSIDPFMACGAHIHIMLSHLLFSLWSPSVVTYSQSAGRPPGPSCLQLAQQPVSFSSMT